MKNYKVGFFGDDIWAHNTVKLLSKDKSINVKFICGRYFTKDKTLKKISNRKKIKFLKVQNVNSSNFYKFLKNQDVDILVSMSFDQIFKKKIIELVKGNIINCHAGKLPFYRGRSVLNWVLINGEKEFGITTHFINNKIDQGKIINQNIFKIRKKDNFKSLLKKCHKHCALLLYKTVKQIQNKNYNALPQSKFSKNFSYFRKRGKGDEILDLGLKSDRIRNFVRGLVKPGPYARIRLKNNEILIKKVTIINNKIKSTLKNQFLNLKRDKLYFKTIDNKIIRIDEWSSKFKINKDLQLNLK
tara:strand:+ start:969 stop:1868 length:900 start_codon:yes stop_codon:yes gene_type:complete